MPLCRSSDKSKAPPGLLQRLARDTSGNTFAIIAAAVAPTLALVGGGIDMGRSYLSQSRLQQACDAGVLAARKKLGSAVVVDGQIPAGSVDIGNRFFNLNFRDGAYGSEDRSFQMTLEEDYAITGEASVKVPTTIMAIFGTEEMDIKVNCQAQLNFSNLDIMMVLDTTGSMRHTNPGDSVSRIQALRNTVVNFHAQLEGSKSPGTRIRYGFVPYSINANVGHLLEDDWVVDEWSYQSRERVEDTDTIYNQTDWTNWTTISGGYSDATHSTYAATWVPGSSGGGSGDSSTSSSGYYKCGGSQPSDTHSSNDTLLSTASEPYAGPPSGTKTTEHYRRVTNGIDYWTYRSGTTCYVHKRTYTNFTQEYDRITYPRYGETWLYGPVTKDVSNWRSETYGCMEERDTYEIYAKDEEIDLSRALDLDLDTVPTSGNPATQWRPIYPNIVWYRSLTNSSSNAWHVDPIEYPWDYYRPAGDLTLTGCPKPARKLAEMTASEVQTYVNALTPEGMTYHDVGMIWGGRLISPTGLYADENVDIDGKTTSRHMIFMTDGQTQPSDMVYGAYGIEALDLRRWDRRPDPKLDRVIELRFFHACNEVKKKNITVWVIGFGTAMNDVMKECAGDGHWFEASNASDLNDVFNKIAKSLAELRITD